MGFTLPSNYNVIKLVLRIMQHIGLLPYVRPCRSQEGSRFSWSSAVSTIMATYVTLIWLAYLIHDGLGFFANNEPRFNHLTTFFEDYIRNNTNLTPGKITMNLYAFRGIHIGLCTSQLVFIFNGRMNGKKLRQLMEGWSSLRQNLGVKLSSQALDRFKWSEPVTYYVVVLHVPCTICVYTIVGTIVLVKFMPHHSYYVLDLWFTGSVFCLLGISESLQDVLTCLMLYELSGTFEKIKSHMALRLPAGKFSQSEVSEWSQMILQARKQTQLFSDYMALPQLSLLLESILTGVLATFLAANGALGAVPFFTPIDIFLSVFLLARIYFKTRMADQVTSQEASVAVMLIECDMKFPLVLNSQLKDLSNLIMMRPTTVSFWDMVTFKRSLSLKVVGQVITYLIVLQQFYES